MSLRVNRRFGWVLVCTYSEHRDSFGTFVAVTGARGEEEDEEARGPREEGGEGLTGGLLRRTKSLITLKVQQDMVKRGVFSSRRGRMSMVLKMKSPRAFTF
jgi:hypothetical protein